MKSRMPQEVAPNCAELRPKMLCLASQSRFSGTFRLHPAGIISSKTLLRFAWRLECSFPQILRRIAEPVEPFDFLRVRYGLPPSSLLEGERGSMGMQPSLLDPMEDRQENIHGPIIPILWLWPNGFGPSGKSLSQTSRRETRLARPTIQAPDSHSRRNHPDLPIRSSSVGESLRNIYLYDGLGMALHFVF
jgi:hypothetical protein